MPLLNQIAPPYFDSRKQDEPLDEHVLDEVQQLFYQDDPGPFRCPHIEGTHWSIGMTSVPVRPVDHLLYSNRFHTEFPGDPVALLNAAHGRDTYVTPDRDALCFFTSCHGDWGIARVIAPHGDIIDPLGNAVAYQPLSDNNIAGRVYFNAASQDQFMALLVKYWMTLRQPDGIFKGLPDSLTRLLTDQPQLYDDVEETFRQMDVHDFLRPKGWPMTSSNMYDFVSGTQGKCFYAIAEGDIVNTPTGDFLFTHDSDDDVLLRIHPPELDDCVNALLWMGSISKGIPASKLAGSVLHALHKFQMTD